MKMVESEYETLLGIMKKNLFYLFVFLIVSVAWQVGYSQTVQQEKDKSFQATPFDPPLQPSKNHFDIKMDEKEGDRFLSEFMNMLSTLGIVVVALLIAAWFLRRMVNSRIQQLNTTSMVKILERRTLTPKTSLFLVDIQGKGFILSESINGVTSLGNFDVSTMEKSQQSPTFQDVMKEKR